MVSICLMNMMRVLLTQRLCQATELTVLASVSGRQRKLSGIMLLADRNSYSVFSSAATYPCCCFGRVIIGHLLIQRQFMAFELMRTKTLQT